MDGIEDTTIKIKGMIRSWTLDFGPHCLHSIRCPFTVYHQHCKNSEVESSVACLFSLFKKDFLRKEKKKKTSDYTTTTTKIVHQIFIWNSKQTVKSFMNSV